MTTGVPSDTTISSNHRGTGKLWKDVNSIVNEFWTRLLKDANTQTTSKMSFNSRRDRSGGLENNTPRDIWPVGKVQKVNRGKDNVAWILENKTSWGIWPVGKVQKVYKCKDNVARSCLNHLLNLI